jgi:hypothetical protein
LELKVEALAQNEVNLKGRERQKEVWAIAVCGSN